MYSQKDASSAHAKRLRKAGGKYLAKLRHNVGLTQRELAVKVGINYYTQIGQLETGVGRIPPQRIEAFAKALDVDLSKFGKKLLQYYDPFMYQVLFGVTAKDDPES